MNFSVRITLPEAPENNLAEQIDVSGFIANAHSSNPLETQEDVVKRDLENYLIAEEIISDERRADLIFDFRILG